MWLRCMHWTRTRQNVQKRWQAEWERWEREKWQRGERRNVGDSNALEWSMICLKIVFVQNRQMFHTFDTSFDLINKFFLTGFYKYSIQFRGWILLLGRDSKRWTVFCGSAEMLNDSFVACHAHHTRSEITRALHIIRMLWRLMYTAETYSNYERNQFEIKASKTNNKLFPSNLFNLQPNGV